MDAPNAPNPTNPNAQDQFVGAVQSPTNQAQGPAAQAQVQGLAAQGTANNNAQVGQNVLVLASTTTGPSTTSPHWSSGACPSGILSKLDREEARILR